MFLRTAEKWSRPRKSYRPRNKISRKRPPQEEEAANEDEEDAAEDNAEAVEAAAELDDLDTRRTMKKPAILVGRQGIMPGLALR